MVLALKLYTLGGLRVSIGDQLVPDLGTRKAEVLLVYLCTQKRPIAREILAEMFWEERAQRRALSNLRVALAALRKALGDYLLVERDTAAVDPQVEVWLDAAQLETQLKSVGTAGELHTKEEAAALAAALDLYRGAFLEGIYLREARAAEEWLEGEREHLARLAVEGLSALVAFHLGQQDYAAGIRFAERLLALDPLNEAAHRWMMRLLLGAGRRSAALAQYEVCRELLEQELGVEPVPQTTALYEQIRSGTSPAVRKAPEEEISKRALPAFLAGEIEGEAHPPVFVARQAELKYLSGRLEKCLRGEGGMAFVVGDPGRGKTALMQAFSRRAQGEHPRLVVAQGYCNAFAGPGDSYLPFRQVLAMLCGDVESQWRAGSVSTEQATRLWEGMPLTAQALLDHGPDVLRLLVDGRGLAARLQASANGLSGQVSRLEAYLSGGSPAGGEGERAAIFEQYRQVIQAFTARQPLLLLIDDLQWADSTSINLLFHLGRVLSGTALMILAAYRPEEVNLERPGGEPHPLAGLLPEFKRQYGDIWLDLGAVDEATGRAFVSEYLESEPNRLPERFADELYRHTGGYPLLTVELLRDLHESGNLIKDQDGYWVEGSQLDWRRLPPRVEGVIEARLNRLESDLRQLLEIASVEGEVFTAQVLGRVQGLPEGSVLDQLDRALGKQHRLVRPAGSYQIGEQHLHRYQFRHVLYQQHLYEALAVGKRELLHREIGSTLEELYASWLEEAAPLLARHFWAAGEARRAVPYLLMAGDQALRVYAHREAVFFYEQALEVFTAEGQREEAAQVLLKLGQAHHIAFDYPAARDAYERAFALRSQVARKRTGSMSLAVQPLRLVVPPPIRLDFGWMAERNTGWYLSLLFSGLVRDREGWYIEPELAQSWEISEDGRRYTFTLRDDASWSDGQPVTAADFEFGWKLSLNPNWNPINTYSKAQMSGAYAIKGAREFHQGQEPDPESVAVCARDHLTLEVELEKPDSTFMRALIDAAFLPISQRVVDQYGLAWNEPGKLVTNGPFMVKDWPPGQPIWLRRNPQYRGRFTGNLEEIEIKPLKIEQAKEALALYEHGEIDVLKLRPEIFSARYDYPMDHVAKNVSGIFFISMNFSEPPLNDRRVRRALGLALDKEILANLVGGGYSLPAWGGNIPSGTPGHSPEIGLHYDPLQARALLAQAGYPNGQGFPLLKLKSAPSMNWVVGHLQDQWQATLNIEIEPYKTDSWEEFMVISPDSLILQGWVSKTGNDPGDFLPEIWNREQYRRLLDQARLCMDQQERIKLYQAADRILMDDAVYIPLFYMLDHWLVRPWVRNWDFWNLRGVVLEPH